MKQTVLAKRYIEVLNLARDSPDALTLLNWTAPRFATKVALVVALWMDGRAVLLIPVLSFSLAGRPASRTPVTMAPLRSRSCSHAAPARASCPSVT